MAVEDREDISAFSLPLLIDDNHKTQKLEDLHGDTSCFKTFFNGLNALSGLGILSIPYALSEGGWLSLPLLFVIAIAAFYSGLLLQRCMIVDSSIKTFPDIGHRAFGNKGRVIVSVLMYIELFLVATGFLILEGDNLDNLFPEMGSEFTGLKLSGKHSFVIIVGLIVLPSVWIDNIGILSYISATGVLASVVILGSILWTGTFDGIGFQQKGRVLNWSGVPTAVSLYAFCYCAHPVFPTLYTSMRTKHRFSYVLLLCFIVATIGNASMAIFGYMMFGSKVQSQITLDLPIGKLSSKIAIYTALINPIAKYALMVTPIVNSTENLFPCRFNKRPLSLFIRTTLVLSTIIVAVVVPFFGYLMSLVGAFFSVTASIIVPCLCYLKISGSYRKFGHESVIIGCILIMGISVVIMGTYTSVLQIVRHL